MIVSERFLPRKLVFQAHGRMLVLRKRAEEKPEHRVMMALLWALYLPRYPQLRIDVPVRLRYRPDLVQLGQQEQIEFWGEAGAVSVDKLHYLCRRLRDTHLVFARWDAQPRAFATLIERALQDSQRQAPVELLGFDERALASIGDDGTIQPAETVVWRTTWGAP